MTDINDLITRARQLAEELMRTPPCHNKRPDGNCLHREKSRPFTAAEMVYYGYERDAKRTFATYDPQCLCTACRAYWYAARAEASLQDASELQELWEIDRAEATEAIIDGGRETQG